MLQFLLRQLLKGDYECNAFMKQIFQNKVFYRVIEQRNTKKKKNQRWVTIQLQCLSSSLVMSSLAANTSLSRVTHIVVVLPAPLCPRKETTWFSWRFRLSLSSASLLPVLYTLVSLSMHTTSGRWLGSSSMPRISSAIHREERWINIPNISALFILLLLFKRKWERELLGSNKD